MWLSKCVLVPGQCLLGMPCLRRDSELRAEPSSVPKARALLGLSAAVPPDSWWPWRG